MEHNNENYLQVLHLMVCRINTRFKTQRAFAQEIGIDPGNLSKFLKGKLYVSSKTFVEMCLVLGIGIFAPIDTKNGFLYPATSF